jgi:hypothetical protein
VGCTTPGLTDSSGVPRQVVTRRSSRSSMFLRFEIVAPPTAPAGGFLEDQMLNLSRPTFVTVVVLAASAISLLVGWFVAGGGAL